MAEQSKRHIPVCPPLPKDLVMASSKLRPPPPPAVKNVRQDDDYNHESDDSGDLLVVRYESTTATSGNGNSRVLSSSGGDSNAVAVSLEDILKTFNAPISEDQAWALIYQGTRMFKARLQETGCRLRDLRLPVNTKHLNVHKDGSCFVRVADEDKDLCVASSQKKILRKLGTVVYKALDYNLPSNEYCPISHELDELIDFMTAEDNDDEGIEHDSEEPVTDEDEAVVADHIEEDDEDQHHHQCNGDGGGGGGGGGLSDTNHHHHHSDGSSNKRRSHLETKELDHVLAFCSSRVSPSKPEDHYRAVCRALATETLELRTFLQRVCQGDAEVLRLKAQAETSGKVLEKIHFNDWARFWMQVVDELRRGVRLKKINFSRTPIEYELTPYEILMEDIRSRKYNLRKVMVDGDIPPKVKKDAHAVILEFIRSRPPLRKASERKLAPQPLKRVSCPREQLLDSIRKGRVLKPVHPKLKTRLLPTTQIDSVKKQCDEIGTSISSSSSSSSSSNSSSNSHHQHHHHSTTSGSGNASATAAAASSATAATSTTSGTSSAASAARASAISAAMYANSPRNTLRLIPVDFSLFEDDDFIIDTAPNGDHTLLGSSGTSSNSRTYGSSGSGRYATLAVTGKRGLASTSVGNGTTTDSTNSHHNHHQRHINNENNQNNINTVLRRTTYDLATQCESRRASMRRHTIIGCNQNYKLDHLSSHSMPPSRPASRQSDHGQQNQAQQPQQQQQSQQPQPQQQQQLESKSQMVVADLVGGSQISSLDTWTKSSLDEHQWKDTFNLNDRLSLTLEEIVHIRSVMTKAELEGLPVDVHIKEDVEKRKVCFLCLRTRFTLFARGILCKLCQRTVCNKCNQKMRIPTEHFRNVPVVLLSPSLMNSPCTSNTPSPSHHAHGGSGPHSLVDESFPRSLMERLLRPELDRRTRNTVGSAPSSPKNQRSASSTPGTSLQGEALSLPLSQPVTTTSATTNGAKESTTGMANTNGSSRCSIMSRSMEGPHSLPPQSPARPHSNSSTLDRSASRNRFAKAFTLSAATTAPATAIDPQKERLTGELMAVCNDCRSLVLEIIRSSRQTRSSAQNQALRNLTLDLSPVYKR